MSWIARLFRRQPPDLQLDADLRRRIRVSFEEAADDDENFPSEIDPRILHVKLILEHLAPAQPKRILDIGCGKGRFARVVKEHFPEAEVWGLDISRPMLRFTPESIHPCVGSMTELPFPDGCFEAVYATESLEHAVEIERAVEEMCRVVRPGGRIVAIDKNRDQWGRLETPEWERWFGRKELERMYGRHCREVSSRPISYWEDVKPDGLFLAWLAVK